MTEKEGVRYKLRKNWRLRTLMKWYYSFNKHTYRVNTVYNNSSFSIGNSLLYDWVNDTGNSTS